MQQHVTVFIWANPPRVIECFNMFQPSTEKQPEGTLRIITMVSKSPK